MRYFKLGEFCRSTTAIRRGIDMTPPPEVQGSLEALVTMILDPLREHLGLPIRITSGYRPPALNKVIGGARSSQHVLGQAADITVEGMSPVDVCRAIMAIRLPFDQLIEEGTWVHVSYSERNRREVLTATFKGGKAIYTPGLHP